MASRERPSTSFSSLASISRHPEYVRRSNGQCRHADASIAWMSATGVPSSGISTNARRVVWPTPSSDTATGLMWWNS